MKSGCLKTYEWCFYSFCVRFASFLLISTWKCEGESLTMFGHYNPHKVHTVVSHTLHLINNYTTLTTKKNVANKYDLQNIAHVVIQHIQFVHDVLNIVMLVSKWNRDLVHKYPWS